MLRAGHVVALCVLALLTLGVLMVTSANMSVKTVEGPQQSFETSFSSILFSKTTAYMVLALGLMLLGSRVPVRGIERGLPTGSASDPARGMGFLILCTIALVGFCGLVYVPGLSRVMNGAHRWISLPVPGLQDALSVQPSEIAKWAMLPLIAWYAAARSMWLPQLVRGLFPALVAIGAVSGFIVLEDLGTGMLIAGVGVLILLAGGARFWHFLAFLPIALAALAAAIITEPYRVNRLLAFADPYADPEGIGYHTIQSLVAVANGEGFGRGLGHGLQKFGYLLEDHTDFLFAVICEELGIPGAVIVVLLFLTLMWAGWTIAWRERDTMCRLWAFGIVLTISLQAAINMFVVTGMAPTKGIALPLLSSGGTGWMLTAFSLGLLIAIDRTQDQERVVFADAPAAA